MQNRQRNNRTSTGLLQKTSEVYLLRTTSRFEKLQQKTRRHNALSGLTLT